MNGTDHPPSLLIVDDDETFRERLARAFVRRGFDVRTAGNHDEAVACAEEDSPEYAVVDLRMPGDESGLHVLREIKRIDASTKVVMLTGYGSIATTVDAMRLGAANYLPKPADAEDILRAFERSELEAESDEQDNSVADVPEEAERASAGERAPTAEPIKAPTLARAEWEHIHRVLADCEGNISEAARRLGIHRRSLQRKLQKFAP